MSSIPRATDNGNSVSDFATNFMYQQCLRAAIDEQRLFHRGGKAFQTGAEAADG